MFALVSLPSPPLFFKQRPPWAARLTSLPSLCIGAKALPELGAAPRATGLPPSPPLSSGAIDRPPQCELVLLTASDGCAMAIDASRGHLPVDVSTVARLQSHRVTCVAPRRRARPTRRVGGDVGHPQAALWATLGQAVPHHRKATQATHTICVGRSRWFWPVDSFLIEIFFYFIPNSF
jgi:hypothetical protein